MEALEDLSIEALRHVDEIAVEMRGSLCLVSLHVGLFSL